MTAPQQNGFVSSGFGGLGSVAPGPIGKYKFVDRQVLCTSQNLCFRFFILNLFCHLGMDRLKGSKIFFLGRQGLDQLAFLTLPSLLSFLDARTD